MAVDLSKIEGLMTADEVAASRVGKPLTKPLPAMVTKKARQKQKLADDDAFRADIWKRDGGRSRATGKPLVKGGTMEWAQLGEVDHAIPRSLAPDRIYDRGNALLLSKEENRLRKIPCPRAPEFRMFDYTGPDDRRLPQTFTWRDNDGRVVKQRVG